jgi:hypothetical protein
VLPRKFILTRLTVLYKGRRPLVINAHGKVHHPQTVTWRL